MKTPETRIMPPGRVIPRLVSIWAMALWIGGFTFYSAVVIPVLHDQLDSPMEAGLVTQRVTHALNILGFVTMLLGWIRSAVERPSRAGRRTGWRWTILALGVFTVCLACLILLHRMLDQKLDSARMEGFYGVHRVYLWISTLQWATGMVLLSSWSLSGCGPPRVPE